MGRPRRRRRACQALGTSLCHDGSSRTIASTSSWERTPQASATRSHNVADGVWPNSGWSAYIQSPSSAGTDIRYRVVGSPRSLADSAWNGVNGKIPSPYKGTKPLVPSDFEYALVVTRRGTVIQLAFRLSRRRETLMTLPAFVTEVRFNGDPEK